VAELPRRPDKKSGKAGIFWTGKNREGALISENNETAIVVRFGGRAS